jgi:hypothetical protein
VQRPGILVIAFGCINGVCSGDGTFAFAQEQLHIYYAYHQRAVV